MRDDKNLIYTHRVRYTFTDKNGPELHNVKFYQDFTKQEWAEEFYQYARKSTLYKNVKKVELLGDNDEQPSDES